MADYTILEDAALQAWLKDHARWTFREGKIRADFTFRDFAQAVSFIVQVAMAAEKQGHHPDIDNTYNKVRLSVNTHEAGGRITSRDIKLAEAIERLE